MTHFAYYNEIDPYAAEWLRNLMVMGHIAPGVVDERSIEDVTPHELTEFTQCHFFAGIGVWSYALRRAGWPDDRPIWTGSCPCQPFSTSGKGTGFADERHLWPHWYWLIGECRPPMLLGEQVASKDAEPWVDLVQADLEAMGYAFGCVPFPSASIGAPHIRDRNYWVGYPHDQGLEGHGRRYSPSIGHREGAIRSTAETGESGGLGDTECQQPGRDPRTGVETQGGEELRSKCDGAQPSSPVIRMADCYCDGRGEARECESTEECNGIERDSTSSGLGNTEGEGRRERSQDITRCNQRGKAEKLEQRLRDGSILDNNGSSGPTNGLWADADWLFCRDGKWRPVEPGTFPLAHGAPARVGRLRAYGNAINAEQATVFIEAVMDTLAQQYN